MNAKYSSFGAALNESLPPDFFHSIFSKREFLIKLDAGIAASLLTWDDLNELINSGNARPPDMKLYDNGRQLRSERFLERDSTGTHIDAAKIYSCLRGGASLIIDSIDRIHLPVRYAADDIMKLFGEVASANMFLTFSTGQAFKPHWDEIDTFVVQVAGSKQWQLHGASILSPTATYGDLQDNICPADVVWEETLTAGHVLHVPRGWWHTVRGAGDVSIHLTFCVRRQTGMDWLRWVLAKTEAADVVRTDLIRPDSSPESSMAQVNQLICAFVKQAEALSPDDFFHEMRINFGRRQVVSLPWGAQSQLPGARSVVRLLAIAPPLLDNTAEEFFIISGGKRFGLAVEYAQACRALIDSGEMTVAELATAGALGRRQAGKLVCALLGQGLVTVDGRV